LSRPKSRDAISIAHLLNSPPDDDFGGRFPVPGALQQPHEDVETAGDNDDHSEASPWSDEMEDSYNLYSGPPEGFDSFFDGLGNDTRLARP
jgi:hypothetical protein